VYRTFGLQGGLIRMVCFNKSSAVADYTWWYGCDYSLYAALLWYSSFHNL